MVYILGDSEEMLGRFLPDYDRKSFVIATKVGRYSKKAKEMFDFSASKTMQSGISSVFPIILTINCFENYAY